MFCMLFHRLGLEGSDASPCYPSDTFKHWLSFLKVCEDQLCSLSIGSELNNSKLEGSSDPEPPNIVKSQAYLLSSYA